MLTWLEKRRPLRKTVESKEIRTVRNLLMAGSASAAMILFEKPAIDFFTKFVEDRRIGFLKIFKLPHSIETILAIILLDYTLYLWHVSTHKVPFLWRFFFVFPLGFFFVSLTPPRFFFCEKNIFLFFGGFVFVWNFSPAFRFHFGKIIFSVLGRIMQFLRMGASPQAVKIWQTLLFPAVLFHHSNLKLPDDWDEKLSQIIITPRLHGIHHSVVQAETDSNWSTILSVWDRLHRTLKTDVNQTEIKIGVPAFQNSQELKFIYLLELPFLEQKPSWQISDDKENN